MSKHLLGCGHQGRSRVPNEINKSPLTTYLTVSSLYFRKYISGEEEKVGFVARDLANTTNIEENFCTSEQWNGVV
jgi:hypothetical protein